MADDDPSPEGFGPQDEEARTVLKILRARFSDFRSPMDSIEVQDSDLSRDCGTGITA